MDSGTHVGRRTFLSAAAGTVATVGYAGTGRGAVDPKLEDRSGRVEGVVRLEAGAIGEDSTGEPRDRPSRERAVTRLRSHAASTQRRVVDYAERTPGVEIRRRFWVANAVLVAVDTERASFTDLAAIDGVDRVHRPDAGTDREPASVEDPGSSRTQQTQERAVSYGLEMMHVPEVWERFDTRGEGARIAIIDTGVDPSHPDLSLTAWAEFDAEGQRVDSDPHDPDGHGTGMSSIATGDDASGTQIGVAPEAELLVARHSREDFFTSSLAALEWAVENGADAVSMSFEFGPLKHDAIEPLENARAAGTVPVASAVVAPEMYFAPGVMDSVLSTGVIDSEATPYMGGNGGEIRTDRFWRSDLVPENWPDRYAAPEVATAGVDVLAAAPDNDEYDGGHVRVDGYSNGPPQLAGVVALLRSLDGDLSPEAIERVLRETAEQPGDPYEHPEPNGDYGYGIANAAAAAAEVRGRDREITGTVTDLDGEPVSDATVSAVTGEAVDTDDRGRYSLAVPDGEATVTAARIGYESVTRRVDPGEGRDLSFESEIRPDIRRAGRPPARVAPGDSVTLELAVEHAEFLTIFVRESPRLLDASAATVKLNGDPATVGEPIEVAEDVSRLQIELDVDEGARGVVPLGVSLADGERDAPIDLDPIHVHERPMQVTEDEDLQAAVDVAVPETTVSLAGDRWNLAVEGFESPFPDARLANPIFERTRDDQAGLVIDDPITLAAADGHEPTLAAEGGSGERTFGVQVSSHFATLEGVEVVAEGATAAVNVLDGDGVHLRNMAVSGADNGVHAQFTKSLVTSDCTISAGGIGVALRDFSVNALVRDNAIRDADTGVFLSGRVGERLFDVDAEVTANTFESVGTDVEKEGTATITDGDGEPKEVGGAPPANSPLDLVLYAATAVAVGVLFYPYARRRLG
jgi:hypothetical protein